MRADRDGVPDPTQCRGRYADWSPEEKKTLPVIVVDHVDEKTD